MDKNLITLGNLLINGNSHQEIVVLLDLFLRNILNFPEEIQKIWHPLGFLMINLGSISGYESIRLHIWENNLRSTQQPSWVIHNHNWTFTSYILCGEITNQVYKITNNQHTPTNKVYQVVYADNKSTLIATNRLVDSTLIYKEKFTKGEKYAITYRQFHTTLVEESTFAATIVFSKKIDTIPPEVIGDLHGIDSYSYQRIPCNNNQFKKIIEKLLSQMY